MSSTKNYSTNQVEGPLYVYGDDPVEDEEVVTKGYADANYTTTVNNNAANTIITGSATEDTLEAVTNLSFALQMGTSDTVSASNNKITRVADPTLAQDVVTKAYGDSNYLVTAGWTKISSGTSDVIDSTLGLDFESLITSSYDHYKFFMRGLNTGESTYIFINFSDDNGTTYPNTDGYYNVKRRALSNNAVGNDEQANAAEIELLIALEANTGGNADEGFQLEMNINHPLSTTGGYKGISYTGRNWQDGADIYADVIGSAVSRNHTTINAFQLNCDLPTVTIDWEFYGIA